MNRRIKTCHQCSLMINQGDTVRSCRLPWIWFLLWHEWLWGLEKSPTHLA